MLHSLFHHHGPTEHTLLLHSHKDQETEIKKSSNVPNVTQLHKGEGPVETKAA
jgi:hypothetical protein